MTYAHKQAESHYDKYPPRDDIVPIAAAINAWTLICNCYMGIEQAMKRLILMRREIKEVPPDLKKGHGHDSVASLDVRPLSPVRVSQFTQPEPEQTTAASGYVGM